MPFKTVDEYIQTLEPWQAEIVSHVRALLLRTTAELQESIKWAQPVYEANGLVCYMKAFKSTVNVGFFRGADLRDPKGLLEGSGGSMRHLKLRSIQAVGPDDLIDFIKQALELNQT